MRSRPALAIALFAVSLIGATCKGSESGSNPPPSGGNDPKPTAEPPEEEVTPPAIIEIPGIDITRLPPTSRMPFLRIANETFCYCGCPRTLAACLSAKEDCSCVRCSERMAQFIMRQFELGLAAEDVELELLEGFTEGYNGAAQTFDIDAQPTKGATEAKYTLVEFADFRCGHCAAAHPILKKLLGAHPEIRLVYYYFPLGDAASESTLAAEAAEEARVQGKFWQMADLLFQNQHALELGDLMGYGKKIGLDAGKLKAALDGHTHREAVMADKNIGQQANVNSTPTIFVNGRKFGLDRTYENFETRLAMEDERGKCL